MGSDRYGQIYEPAVHFQGGTASVPSHFSPSCSERFLKKRNGSRTVATVVRKISMEPQRTCPSCSNEFSGAMEFCPVCLLRKGLAGGVVSGESSTEAIR
jgi:hypothetical protein